MSRLLQSVFGFGLALAGTHQQKKRRHTTHQQYLPEISANSITYLQPKCMSKPDPHGPKTLAIRTKKVKKSTIRRVDEGDDAWP